MTRDDIIRWAREAQQEDFASDTGHWFKLEVRDLERFARRVAEHERDECSSICLKESEKYDQGTGERMVLRLCAAAIRARGQQ